MDPGLAVSDGDGMLWQTCGEVAQPQATQNSL